MNFVQTFFEERVTDYAKELAGIGFSMDQTFGFLPIAALDITHVSQKTSVYQTISCLLSKRCHHLHTSIDINSTAITLGLETEQVKAGFRAIAPILLEDLFHKGQPFIQSEIEN